MKSRSLFLVLVCFVIACGVLTVPSDARVVRKIVRRPVIVVPPPPPRPIIVVPPRPVVVPVAPRAIPPRAAAAASYGPTFGIGAGYMAGIPGVNLEVRFPDPFQIASTTCRLSVAYAKGNDTAATERANTLVGIDGILRLSEGSGVRSYVGAGLNYNVATSVTGGTSQSGSYGGQVFYGIEAGAPGAQIFGEVGYSYIRTGFSPSYKGLNAIIGFKM